MIIQKKIQIASPYFTTTGLEMSQNKHNWQPSGEFQ